MKVKIRLKRQAVSQPESPENNHKQSMKLVKSINAQGQRFYIRL